jgi:hypothetical protein
MKELRADYIQGIRAKVLLSLLSSCLLSKNINIKIYKIVILPAVLYGCETLSLTVREEHRLRVFEKRMLRRMFDLRGRKWPKA